MSHHWSSYINEKNAKELIEIMDNNDPWDGNPPQEWLNEKQYRRFGRLAPRQKVLFPIIAEYFRPYHDISDFHYRLKEERERADPLSR